MSDTITIIQQIPCDSEWPLITLFSIACVCGAYVLGKMF